MGPVRSDQDEDVIAFAHELHVRRTEAESDEPSELDPWLYAADPDEWEWER
jgi:hypothetical protein